MLHIDQPSRAEIEKLANFKEMPAVSIYLRTTPTTQDAQADRIELKNLLKEAVAQLEAAGVDKRVIWPIEEGVNEIIADDDFWAVQANSLAIFATKDRVRTFRLPNKLTNQVEVSDRFHLKPLLRSVAFPHHAYVLVLSVGAVRLIEISPDLPPHRVNVPHLPRDFYEAVGRRSHLEKDRGLRSGEETSENALLTRFSRAVDSALRPYLKGETAPLILAASEPLNSVYRNAASYSHIAAQPLSGNHTETPDHVLADEARKVLDGIYAQEIADLGALFAARAAHGRATNDLSTAARAATFGAVDTLILDMDVTISGQIDETTGVVSIDDKPDAVNYGVIDEIARRVLQSGGRVVSARRDDVPMKAELAAILRYPV